MTSAATALAVWFIEKDSKLSFYEAQARDNDLPLFEDAVAANGSVKNEEHAQDIDKDRQP